MTEKTKSLEMAPRTTPEASSPSRTPTPSVSPSAVIQGAAGNMAIQRAAREEGGKDAPVRSEGVLNFPSVEVQLSSPLAEPPTKFVMDQSIPPVMVGFQSPTTSASDLAYGAPFQVPPAHQRHSDSVRRIHSALLLAERDAEAITQTLIPSYKNARDSRDFESVAELGGKMLGAFTRMNGAKAAVEEMRRTAPHQSIVGSSVDQDLENYQLQQFVDTHAPSLEQKVSQTAILAMVAMVPREFRGEAVAGVSPMPDMEGPPELLRARMAGELDRTLQMLILVQEITEVVLAQQAKLDHDALDRARSKLWRWGSRPIDLAFLKAALGPVWNLLDATAGPHSKPSDALDEATKQAQHTGWLGDIGEFSIQDADMWLRLGGQDNAAIVLKNLYTTDPNTRARLLMQMKERNLLHKFCSSFGWEPIKELHDSLGTGFGEIKTDLQGYFIGGKDKWGPSLGSEWESHSSSLHHHIGRLGWVGDALNFVYDLATFGFHSSYGKSRDAFTSGQMSEGDYSNSKRHLVNRTAAMAFVSLLTGGAANKFVLTRGAANKLVHGGAATVSTARATGAGFAGGFVGSPAGLATSDAYNVYISGQQESFSSPEDYVTTALVGGGFGAAFGGVLNGLSKRARSHVPDEAIAAPAAPSPAVKPNISATPLKAPSPAVEPNIPATPLKQSKTSWLQARLRDVLVKLQVAVADIVPNMRVGYAKGPGVALVDKAASSVRAPIKPAPSLQIPAASVADEAVASLPTVVTPAPWPQAPVQVPASPSVIQPAPLFPGFEESFAETPTSQNEAPYETTTRLKQGNFGEREAARALAQQGHTILLFKPDILGTNQGGIDIVTIQDGIVYFVDNKAYSTGRNVSSVSALDRNLVQNVRDVRDEFAAYAADPLRSQNERDLFAEAVRSIDAGNYQKAVTTFALAPPGAQSGGVTPGLHSKGFIWINLFPFGRPP